MPRLFIYATEAGEKPEPECSILRSQFKIMMKRLWLIITWPSAILTLIIGPVVMFTGGWAPGLFKAGERWLLLKIIFVLLLYGYFFSLHKIYKQQMNDVFKLSSMQLRIWNEVATVFLVIIVMLATVKSAISIVWGAAGITGLMIVLLSAIRIYKFLRTKNNPV